MIRIRKLMVAAFILFLEGCATFVQQPQVKEWHDSLTGMEFVLVKEGCFQMGDTFGDGFEVERPAHEVCLNEFWMGKYEVTQGQWEKVKGANPSEFKRGAAYPVENVKWEDAQEFIRRFNELTGKRFRLPTEAEWEYAARSGGRRERWAGTNSESELSKYAWYSGHSDGKTHPVGEKQPNGLQLYDMSGNVWEWVQDWYDKDYYRVSPKNNPEGPSSLRTYRGLRGGSWNDIPKNIRTTSRSGSVGPRSKNPYTGFRLVLPSQ